MKTHSWSSLRSAAITILCVSTLAASSFAATKPLSYPYGLAVDAKGNLYVANNGSSEILVYNPNYEQVPSKTITSGIVGPTGVAFDPQGNLWVANYGASNGGDDGSVAEYVDGKEGLTITNAILGPEAISVDALGNIWVENDFTNVTVYGQLGIYPNNDAPTTLLQAYTPSTPIYGIATSGNIFAWGSNAAVNFAAETFLLLSGQYAGWYIDGQTFSLAADAHGNFYEANFSGQVTVSTPGSGITSSFATLSFTPNGIAVDSVRGRVYFSNYNGNSISVYNTSGELLKVIQ